MSLKFALHNPLDPSDPSDGLWDSSALSLLSLSQRQTAAPPTPLVLPAETYEAQAAVSASGAGGPGSVIAETSGGLTINLEFDAAAMAAPASFRAGIEQAAAMLSAAISDKITVNIQIDYSGTGGGAAAGPDDGQWVSYSTVRADLVKNASPGDTTFNTLPVGSSIQGQSSVAVWNAQLKLWGLLGANDTTTDDGSATFATDINPNLLVGVALHELTHAMGRVPYGPQPDVFDFYRYTSPGVRLFTESIPATAAYFSLNGGNTKIADYGQNSDPSDFLNSGVQGGNDPFNEYYSNSTLQQLTAIDLKQLDALGFHLTSQKPIVIQTDGTTSLVQVGSDYFLDAVGRGTGPQLYLKGAPVTAGELAGWTPIGAIQTTSGYDVAWKNAQTGQYGIWSTDSNGNYLGNLTPAVPGNSYALESYETIFHQDLNGDGTIGVPTHVIQVDGSTSLTEVGNNFYLYDNGVGPSLKLHGVAVTAGQLGGWTPIGAIQTASGYDVAWKIPGANQYAIWNTDSNGNHTSNLTPAVPGNNPQLESYETIFHQDLNGDGTIGVPSATSPAAAQPTQASQTSFDDKTLTLDTPSTFGGELIGFGRDGTLAGSDQVDLRGFNFDKLHTSFESLSGSLALSSGSSATSLQFLGRYSQDSVHFADDGNGGTPVIVATTATQATVASEVSSLAAHDRFVFAENFGHITLPNCAPAIDTLQLSKAAFADITALLAATHDDSSGHAVITDAAHDTITLQHVTTAQLITHQSDFHFV
jgi:hypothetical protein